MESIIANLLTLPAFLAVEEFQKLSYREQKKLLLSLFETRQFDLFAMLNAQTNS